MFLPFSASGAGGTLLDEEESGTLGRLIGSGAGMWGVLLGKWIFFALMVVWSHWYNMVRLVNGTEPKIGQKKPPVPAVPEMVGHNGGPRL